MEEIITMRYSRYKQRYADCEIVHGSYDKYLKTIDVIIPAGRMKASGVRGQRFHGYELWFEQSDGTKKFCTYRAVSLGNAQKQHERVCRCEGWKPCEPPEGRIARIYS